MMKKFKKMTFIPVCLLLMITAGTFLLGCKKQEVENAGSTETEEIKLEKGQWLVYGQIASINGNEITYYVMNAEEEVAEDDAQPSNGVEAEETTEQPEKAEGKGKERPQMPEGVEGERPQMPEGGFPGGGEMPEGFEPGKMPEGVEGERPQMPEGGFPGGGEMPEGFEPGKMPEGVEGERPQMPERDDVSKQEEETVTVQIPVGTPVTTRLGAETTFSRLAVGDKIKMLVQQEDGQQVILAVWIVD